MSKENTEDKKEVVSRRVQGTCIIHWVGRVMRTHILLGNVIRYISC